MTANCRSKNIDNNSVHRLRVVLACLLLTASVSAQAQKPNASAQSIPVTAAAAAAPRVGDPAVPADYVIGPDDLLSIMYWKDKDMSADAKVRPD